MQSAEHQQLIDFLSTNPFEKGPLEKHLDRQSSSQERTEEFFDRVDSTRRIIAPPPTTPATLADNSSAVLPDGLYTVCFYPVNLPASERDPLKCSDYVTLRVRTQPVDSSFKPGDQVVGYLVGSDNESDYVSFAHVTTRPATATPQASPINPQFAVWHRFKRSLIKGHEPHVLLQVLLASPIKHAQSFGLKSKRCSCCGRTLTVPSSIAAGIGPVCAARFTYR